MYAVEVRVRLGRLCVGIPVNFTTHNGSVSGNHGMQICAAALL